MRNLKKFPASPLVFTHLSFVSCSKASFLFTRKHSPPLMGTSLNKNSLQKGLLEKHYPCSGLHISLKNGQNFDNTNLLQFYLLLVGSLSGKDNGLQALKGLHTKSWKPKKPERLARWLRTLKVRSELQGVSLLQLQKQPEKDITTFLGLGMASVT